MRRQLFLLLTRRVDIFGSCVVSSFLHVSICVCNCIVNMLQSSCWVSHPTERLGIIYWLHVDIEGNTLLIPHSSVLHKKGIARWYNKLPSYLYFAIISYHLLSAIRKQQRSRQNFHFDKSFKPSALRLNPIMKPSIICAISDWKIIRFLKLLDSGTNRSKNWWIDLNLSLRLVY